MVLASGPPPSPGGGDLFASFRRPGGGWSEPAHLRPNHRRGSSGILSNGDAGWQVSLFQPAPSSESWAAPTPGDVYWVDSLILDQLRRNDATRVSMPLGPDSRSLAGGSAADDRCGQNVDTVYARAMELTERVEIIAEPKKKQKPKYNERQGPAS